MMPITPEAFAKERGFSPRRVRKLARELGACRICGRTMSLEAEDVRTLLEALKPCPLLSTDDTPKETGITAAPLPRSAFEVVQERLIRKLHKESQPKKQRGTGKVVSMDLHRS